jgi:hypothetical protein
MSDFSYQFFSGECRMRKIDGLLKIQNVLKLQKDPRAFTWIHSTKKPSVIPRVF